MQNVAKNVIQYRTADLWRNQFVITMRIKHTIGYKVRIIRSAFYPYIFDSLDFRSWVKRGPSPHFVVRKLPVDGPQVGKSAVRILPMPIRNNEIRKLRIAPRQLANNPAIHEMHETDLR